MSDREIVLAAHPTAQVANLEGHIFVYLPETVQEPCPTCGHLRERIVHPGDCQRIGTRAWPTEAGAWADAAVTLEKAGKS